MSTSAFQTGATFDIGRKRYTLLRKIEADLWQAEESRSRRIEEFTDEKLRELYVSTELRFFKSEAPGPGSTKAVVLDASPEQWELAKIRRAYVMAILDVPSTRRCVTPLIRELWAKLQRPPKTPGASSVLRWKSRFVNAGRDIRVLIDRDDRKGNCTPRFDTETERIVDDAIEAKFLTRERGTMQDVVDEAVVLVRRENAVRPSEMQLPLPSLRLVKRLIDRIPAFDRYAARYGRTAAVKRFRAVLGHRTSEAPLARVEMDHTLLDLMVIDERTNLPLGRPFITACIDDYTRCVLGVYVSFEPPSYFSVARCLKHAFMPKVGLRDEYPSIQNDWVAYGVMRELVVDNGPEFHSLSLENACYSLGIEIHYAPRKQAWFKGKIERHLGSMNRAVAHKAPGTTFGNILEKDEYDPSKHAVVRYRVLKEVIHKWVCDFYQQKPHRALDVSPAAMWTSSISPEEILVPEHPEMLDAILGKSEQRCLTHKGIELHGGLFYNSVELTELRRKHGDKLDVEVRVDTADLGSIVVFSPGMKQLFKVPAIDLEYPSGLSLWQHKVIKRFAALELKNQSNAGWLEAKAQIAEMIDQEFHRVKPKSRARIARFMGDSQLIPDSKSSSTLDVAHRSRAAGVIGSMAPEAENAVVEVAPARVPVVDGGASASTPAARKKVFKAVYRARKEESLQSDGDEEIRDA